MQQEIIRINLNAVNCYLIKSKEGFILVDTGGYIILDKQLTNRRDLLQKELDKAGCNADNLKLVILTHGDYDHVSNAVYLREKYKVKIALHPMDLDLVKNPNLKMLMQSFRYRSVIFKIIFSLMKKKIEKVNLQILNEFQKFTPDILIDDKFNLLNYGFHAKIVPLSGHTAGSIGILMPNGDLIAGDTFVNNSKPEISLNAYDFNLLSESVNRLKQLNIKTVYPGHGNPFSFKELKFKKL